jgi:hypothetical protein
MNKYIITIFLGISNFCQSQEWYSKVNREHIEAQDNLFYKEYSKTHQEFIKQLVMFKGFLVTGNADGLYSFRTDLFKNTVSKDAFSEYLCDRRELPTRVVYSLNGSKINDRDAIVKAYYITRNDNFEICVETNDIWKRIDKKWFFISNTLSWGTEVVSAGILK